MGDLAMDEDRPFSLPSFAAPLCNPDPSSIRAETWVGAEDPVREVLNCIHPTLDSEEKRKDVIEYVQRLIRCALRLEVFPYGSVPLKTYLPDGDIDLTVLSTPNLDELLPRDVLAILQAEEQNGNSEFELKDTQFIDAEVKLVKCLVQDIVIDISFNQLGGLRTLCFLEQVDRRAGKDHLFKRNIILIKAWCCYESRILGAHHGLISTYALETLVLYIFHVFSSSLNGPIEVLYRFLDYYSKFDWDNYCISLDGPVSKSSLPNLTVDTPENQENDVLLNGEFRRIYMDTFIVPSKGLETDARAFSLKHLNIIDPLKENNNLGRSVHKGNYYRIRSAFRFGARKLGRILQLPNLKIGDEIKKFFTNTLQRHKPKYGPKTFGNLSISSLSEACYDDDVYSKFSNGDSDDYLSGRNDQNAPLCTEPDLENGSLDDEKTGLELIVDGDTICLCINKNNNDNLSLNIIDGDATASVTETEILNPFSDLMGDYESHIRSLLYGQCCHGYALSAAVVRTSPPTSPYGNGNINPWEPAVQPWSVPFQGTTYVNGTNGAVLGRTTYVNGTNGAMNWEERRGTGPYIPVMNCSTCKERPLARGRGKSRGPPVSNGHLQRVRGGSVEPRPVVDPNHAGQGSHESSPRQARVNPDSSSQTQQPPGPVNSTANGFINSQRKLEFGSFRALPETASDAKYKGRVGENSFLLKNEDEFPPLSGARVSL